MRCRRNIFSHPAGAVVTAAALLATSTGCGALIHAASRSGGDRSADAVMTVVFSKQPITSDTLEAASGLTTDFEIGEPIYARIYTLDGSSIRSHQSSPGSPINFGLVWPQDDGSDLTNRYSVELDAAALEQGYADVDVFPDGGLRQKGDNRMYTGILRAMTHYCETGASSVTVGFTLLNWGGESFDVRCSEAGLARAETMARATTMIEVEDVRMDEPRLRDEALEAAMARVAENTPERTGGGEALRVVIVRPSWEMKHDAHGQVVGRTILADIAFKRADPELCYIENVRFDQDLAGSDFDNLHIPTTDGSNVPILCQYVHD